MDTITQALLGAVVAEAGGFREKLGPRALGFGALCAAIPDLDIAAAVAGEWATMIHHRGITHSLVAYPVMAPALGWLHWRLRERDRRKRADESHADPPAAAASWHGWAWLAFFALLSHPLLDVCTSYGTQLLFPLTDRRFAIDAVSIIDFLYTLPLVVAVLISRSARFTRARARQIAVGVLAGTTLYLGIGLWQGERAKAWAAEELTAEGFEVATMRALPSRLNIWLRRILARDPAGNIRIGYVSTLAPRRPIPFMSVPPAEDPLVADALRSEHGELLIWFSGGMLSAEVERGPGGAIVHFSDLRFGAITRPNWGGMGAAAHYDSAGNLVGFHRERRFTDMDFGAELSATWAAMWGRL